MKLVVSHSGKVLIKLLINSKIPAQIILGGNFRVQMYAVDALLVSFYRSSIHVDPGYLLLETLTERRANRVLRWCRE